MNVYVLDRTFQTVALIDDYISLIWTQRYNKRGDFEIMVKASKENIAILKKGNYLVREKDLGSRIFSVMIVQNITVQTDVENGDNLIVSGYDVKDIIHRRVIASQTVFNNQTVKSIVQALLNNNIINAETNRKISEFAFDSGPNVGSSDYLTMQVTGDNLGDYIEELLDKFGYGYEVYLYGTRFYLRLVKGADRSMEQSVNQYVIFSESFDNLLTSNYQNFIGEFANFAYVAGEGEGSDRRILGVGSGSGLDRYELWVDARDISSNDGEISSSEYEAMLEARGLENLAEHSVETLFEGNVNDTVNYKLGVDYKLGDIVQVVTDYGISLPARITEIIESDDTEGEQMIPTFEYKGGNS